MKLNGVRMGGIIYILQTLILVYWTAEMGGGWEGGYTCTFVDVCVSYGDIHVYCVLPVGGGILAGSSVE